MDASDFSGAIKASDSTTLIGVAVSANAKENKISGYDAWRKRLNVKIKAPRAEGRANMALLDFFAKFFGVSKSDVRIVSGEKSNLKNLQLNLTSEKVVEILGACLK